jgi:hypothetical protein
MGWIHVLLEGTVLREERQLRTVPHGWVPCRVDLQPEYTGRHHGSQPTSVALSFVLDVMGFGFKSSLHSRESTIKLSPFPHTTGSTSV